MGAPETATGRRRSGRGSGPATAPLIGGPPTSEPLGPPARAPQVLLGPRPTDEARDAGRPTAAQGAMGPGVAGPPARARPAAAPIGPPLVPAGAPEVTVKGAARPPDTRAKGAVAVAPEPEVKARGVAGEEPGPRVGAQLTKGTTTGTTPEAGVLARHAGPTVAITLLRGSIREEPAKVRQKPVRPSGAQVPDQAAGVRRVPATTRRRARAASLGVAAGAVAVRAPVGPVPLAAPLTLRRALTPPRAAPGDGQGPLAPLTCGSVPPARIAAAAPAMTFRRADSRTRYRWTGRTHPTYPFLNHRNGHFRWVPLPLVRHTRSRRSRSCIRRGNASRRSA